MIVMDSISYHQNRTTAIESRAICGLPYVLDVVCIDPHESFSELFEDTFNSFCMPFKRCLAPSDCAVGDLDTDE